MTRRDGKFSWLAPKRKRKKNRGFTLIELLISIVIASIVTSGLLYLVNELVRVDRREAKLENVQRDMQRAMNYIADDLREAVYVYPDPTIVTDRLKAADLLSKSTSLVPVLAFWLPESLTPLEYNDNTNSARPTIVPVDCSKLTDSIQKENCNTLQLRQSYYSLVVYFALDNEANSTNWKGQARIVRYVLPEYTQDGMKTGTQRPGYAAPNNDFLNWVPDPKATGLSPIPVVTLVDYLDKRNPKYDPLVVSNSDPNPNPVAKCPAKYIRSPAKYAPPDPAKDFSNSFAACVGDPGADAGVGTNQDVIVYMRGNAKTNAQELANPTPKDAKGNQSNLPTLKTQVLVRGAVNKNPN